MSGLTTHAIKFPPLGRKVYAIVNYDNFQISSEVIEAYMEMVSRLVDRFYIEATLYTTSSFLRMKFGNALEDRDVAPDIYDTRDEAVKRLKL